MKKSPQFVLETQPHQLAEGLFGNAFNAIIEVLPYLYSQAVFPDWQIRAALYGGSERFVVPGALDLTYEVPLGARTKVNLIELHRRHRHILGGDWQGVSSLWQAYFRIPARILERAAGLGLLSHTIGIHYRGNDKQTASWDSNPVSYDHYWKIIQEFCRERPTFTRIFLATDDPKFHRFLSSRSPLEVVNLGDVAFHKDPTTVGNVDVKIDRAMLDCVALSRCGVVLLTSSALPSYAKILQPNLEIYRVAASKIFGSTPYFPVAYIPRYKPRSKEVADIIESLMLGDWSHRSDAHLFAEPFVSRRLYPPLIRAIYSYVRPLLPNSHLISRLPNLIAGRLPR